MSEMLLKEMEEISLTSLHKGIEESGGERSFLLVDENENLQAS